MPNEMFSAAEFFELEHTAHSKLFETHKYVWEALKQIPSYLQFRLKPAVLGELVGKPFVSGSVFIGSGTIVEQGAMLKGPAWIGENCSIRSGCYVRENVIVGNSVVMGNSCEFKNCIIFDEAQIPHFSYVGDSIIGYKTHLGAGVILSNVKLDHAEISVLATDGMIATGLTEVWRDHRRSFGNWMQCGLESRLGHWPRLHRLSWNKFPRGAPGKQHHQSATDNPSLESAPA